MCEVVYLLFGVEDCSIIVFCHLCVLVCDFIVHYSIFLNVLSPIDPLYGILHLQLLIPTTNDQFPVLPFYR